MWESKVHTDSLQVVICTKEQEYMYITIPLSNKQSKKSQEPENESNQTTTERSPTLAEQVKERFAIAAVGAKAVVR